MPACDVVARCRATTICDVRFNDITSLARHIYGAIFFFDTESPFFAFLNANLWKRIFRRCYKQIITLAFWSSPLISTIDH